MALMGKGFPAQPLGRRYPASLMPRRWNRSWAKGFRKVSALPITLLVRGNAGGGRGLDRVGSGVAGMAGHVGGAGCVTSGPGGGPRRTFLGVTGSGVGGYRGGAGGAARNLPTRPGPRCRYGLARAIVLRVLLLEARKHMLGTVGGPERQ